MSTTKFHIEECNNGWLLTINPTDTKNPTEQFGQMMGELKKLIPGSDEDLESIMGKINAAPQNEKVVFVKFADLLGFLSITVSEDFKKV